MDQYSDHAKQATLIFELSPFPMWIYDLNSLQFLAVNKEAIRHYGYTEEEFLSMTLKDIRPVNGIPKLKKAVGEARTGNKLSSESLFRHQKKDGSVIYVQIKANHIHFKGKEAEIVTAVDLSDRYRQEKKIEEQRQYLSTIGALDEILLKSQNWIEALDQCFKIIGETLDVDRIYFFETNLQEETASQRLEWSHSAVESQIANPELQDLPFSMFSLFLDPLQNGKPFEAITSQLEASTTKDLLAEQDIQSVLALPVIVNNDLCGFIGLDDCSKERKWQNVEFQVLRALTSNLAHVIKEAQAHQNLIDSEVRFRTLVQNATDLIATVDHQGYFTYVAPTSTKVLGISPEEFIQRSAFDFIHEEDIPHLKECLEEVLQEKRVATAPYRFSTADGNWRWIQTELTNHLADPVISGIVANTREVTAEVEKRMSEELLASLTKAISRPGGLTDCLGQALDQLVKLPKICVSEVWLISEDRSRLNLISKSCKEEKLEAFYQNRRSIDSFEKGAGLQSHLWETREPCVWDKLPQNNRFFRSRAAESANLSTAIGVPLVYNEEFLGCFICFSQFEQQELSDQVKLLTEVGLQIGAVVKQKVTEVEYRHFFDISPDPHCILGFDGYIKKFNNAFNELLGYESAELLNNPVFKFLHAGDRTKSREKLISSIHGDNSKSFEARFLTKGGEVRWLIWNGTVMQEAKVVIAVAKDITAQKMAEQELSTAYERLRAAQKMAKLGYWLRDFDSEISEWSEETYKIYGYTPANFVPTMENVIKTFHPDDRHLIKSDPTDNLQPGKVQSFEHRILTGSDEVKWVRQEIRLVTNEEGVTFRIEGTILDITESKEYELQLSLSNERFKLAMQASNEMIWEIDHDSNMIHKSTGYKETIHYETNEAFSINNSWFSSIHPQDRGLIWETLQTALKDKEETYWKQEYKVVSRDGSIAYFIDRCYIVRDQKGRAVRSVGAAMDITESREQLEQIKKQNERFREISWLQSHVIRAPLVRIMGLINLAKESDQTELTQDELMDLLSSSAEELDQVIHVITQKTESL